MSELHIRSIEFGNIVLLKADSRVIGSNAWFVCLTISEVNRYDKNVIWIHWRKVCICDCDGGFLVPRNELLVQNTVKIKLAFYFSTMTNYLCNSLPRPYFFLWTGVGRVKSSQSITLSLDDDLRIISWMLGCELDIITSMWRDW